MKKVIKKIHIFSPKINKNQIFGAVCAFYVDLLLLTKKKKN